MTKDFSLKAIAIKVIPIKNAFASMLDNMHKLQLSYSSIGRGIGLDLSGLCIGSKCHKTENIIQHKTYETIESKNYINQSEYNNITIKAQYKKRGRPVNLSIKKETERAFMYVVATYEFMLMQQSKNRVRDITQFYMLFGKLDQKTFNRLYRDCPCTRGPGNPNCKNKTL